MTYLSSSTTISRGVRAAAGGASVSFSPGIRKTTSDLFHGDVVVRIDVDLRGDQKGLARDVRGGELGGVLQERPRRRQREGAPGPDRQDAFLGRDQVARAGDQKRAQPV